MGIEKKEKTVDEYIREQQINMTWPTITALCEHQSWFFQNWWLWTFSAFAVKKITNGDGDRRNNFR